MCQFNVKTLHCIDIKGEPRVARIREYSTNSISTKRQTLGWSVYLGQGWGGLEIGLNFVLPFQICIPYLLRKVLADLRPRATIIKYKGIL